MHVAPLAAPSSRDGMFSSAAIIFMSCLQWSCHVHTYKHRNRCFQVDIKDIMWMNYQQAPVTMQLLALASILLSVVFDGKYEEGNFARRMEACNASLSCFCCSCGVSVLSPRLPAHRRGLLLLRPLPPQLVQGHGVLPLLWQGACRMQTCKRCLTRPPLFLFTLKRVFVTRVKTTLN